MSRQPPPALARKLRPAAASRACARRSARTCGLLRGLRWRRQRRPAARVRWPGRCCLCARRKTAGRGQGAGEQGSMTGRCVIRPCATQPVLLAWRSCRLEAAPTSAHSLMAQPCPHLQRDAEQADEGDGGHPRLGDPRGREEGGHGSGVDVAWMVEGEDGPAALKHGRQRWATPRATAGGGTAVVASCLR